MKSVVLDMSVDDDVDGPGSCIEPELEDGFFKDLTALL